MSTAPKVIVFNGETYNYRDLRDELFRRGHVFRSRGGHRDHHTSPTRVLEPGHYLVWRQDGSPISRCYFDLPAADNSPDSDLERSILAWIDKGRGRASQPPGVRAAPDRFVREGLGESFVVANAEKLPFRDGAASVTWTSLLLHHLPRLDEIIPEFVHVTRDRPIAFEPNASNFLMWLAMNVINRLWGLSAMTPNQRALWPGRLAKLFGSHGLEANALRYIHREWSDSMGVVRRADSVLTAWPPLRFRAKKYLAVDERRRS